MDFDLNFYRIFIDFIPYFKSQKRGLISAGSAEDTWRAELTWPVELARMRRGTQGHVAKPHEPTRGAHVAQTRGRDHASPRGCPSGATWQGANR